MQEIYDDAAALRREVDLRSRTGAATEAATLLGLLTAAKPTAEACVEAAERWLAAGHPGEAVPWYRRAAKLSTDPATALSAARQAAAEAQRACGQTPPPSLPEDPNLIEALGRVPPLASADWAGLRFTALAGSRNKLYRIDDPASGDSYILRQARSFPPTPWWRYRREEACLAAAHRVGLAPEPLYFGLADGLLLTRFVAGPNLSRASFRDAALLGRVADSFRRLHAGPPLPGPRDMFAPIDRLERDLRPETGPPDLPRWRERFHEWRAILADNRVPVANCHNDPIPENMIDTPGGVVLIDWEFAGLTDPDYELGYILAHVRQGETFERRWLTACYGAPDHPRAARAALYRAALRYYWLLKALGAKQAGQPRDKWLSRANRCLDFLRGTVPTPAFEGQVATLRDYRWSS